MSHLFAQASAWLHGNAEQWIAVTNPRRLSMPESDALPDEIDGAVVPEQETEERS